MQPINQSQTAPPYVTLNLFQRPCSLCYNNLLFCIEMNMREYFVYILSSATKVLYVGVTNNLEHRAIEHKHKINEGFTKKYSVNFLVYYESHPTIFDAIDREKQLKNWHRQWKINLIESINPHWEDLSEGWDAETSSA